MRTYQPGPLPTRSVSWKVGGQFIIVWPSTNVLSVAASISETMCAEKKNGQKVAQLRPRRPFCPFLAALAEPPQLCYASCMAESPMEGILEVRYAWH